MSDIPKTQRSFARKALAQPNHRFSDLYHLLYRDEWLEQALANVLSNTGARTAGVDGITREHLQAEAERQAFLAELRRDLRTGAYQPMPTKRIWIPKPGKDEKRGLGIPTIRDRVVQELLRMLMEPIWESDFLNCSHGFRPGHRTMDCIREFYTCVNTHSKYYWIIEGDIRKCFDRINHKILLRLIRRRIADRRVVALIEALLKAGLMDGALFHETPEGTPQGGIASPLLANVYLHELDLWWWRRFGSLNRKGREKLRRKGEGIAKLVRYADDFVILWNGTHQQALALRDELKTFLWDELHLELAEEKTHVTHATDGVDFLGFHIRLELERDRKPWLRVTPSRENVRRFKAKIKALTKRGTTYSTPEMRFKALNRVIRGWGNYYRHCSFTVDACTLDWWINQRVVIWLKNYHQGVGVRRILEQYKRRERVGHYNRWNLAATTEKGNPVFIAKLADIPLRPYLYPKREHPYLAVQSPSAFLVPETPFLEPKVVNLPPESVEWHETRLAVLERDGHRCTRCGTPAQAASLDVHHVTARRDGGTDALDNLVTLCRKCHGKTSSFGRPPKRQTN